MFALNKKTGYALIALTHLARNSGEVVSARTVAEECHIPQALLTNVLKDLARAEIVQSHRGAAGGYQLANPPEAVTLDQVITAMEGEVQFVRCVLSGDVSAAEPCDLELACPIRSPASRIHEHFKRFLESVTLAELLADDLKTVPPECLDRVPEIAGQGCTKELSG